MDPIFSTQELSAAISNLPTRIGNPNDAALFRNIAGTTKEFTVEFYKENQILVPTTAWGGVAPKNSDGERTAESFAIPHMPLEDVVLAADVIGVRAFGSTQAETVQGKVLDKLQQMKNKIDATLAFRRSKAKQGVILDANGSTIVDYNARFGVTPQVVYFNLATATTNILAKCQDVIDMIEDGLGQEVYSSIEVEVDRTFYDALTNHKSVKDVFLGWSAAEQRLGRSNTSGFEFGGLKFIVNRQSVGGTPIVASNTGHAYPVGTQDVFLNALAPADFNETANTLALPYYAKQRTLDYDRGFGLHVQSNQLPIVAKPKALVKVSGAASA